MDSIPPLLELRGISRDFGGIQALSDISLEIRPGRILCLLGDNGAGKSTLIKIISGFYQPSAGQMLMEGAEISFSGPRHARSIGIATVHQVVGTIPMMSVGRNFFLGTEPTRGWGPFKRIDMEKADRIALEQIRLLGITRVNDGEQLVGTLSGGERQALAIARAIYFGARVLILDEPTSALGVRKSAIVLRLISKVRASGVAIVFITHNARHAMKVGEDFVVLIHGRVAAKFVRGEKSRDEILNLMAGGDESEQLDDDLSDEGESQDTAGAP